MLSELHTMGIRTAVISNLDFSGYLLKTRMDALLPEHMLCVNDYTQPIAYLKN